MLEKDASKRLGAAKGNMFSVGGVAALRQHEFFDGKHNSIHLPMKVFSMLPPASLLHHPLNPLLLSPPHLKAWTGRRCSARSYRAPSTWKPPLRTSPSTPPCISMRVIAPPLYSLTSRISYQCCYCTILLLRLHHPAAVSLNAGGRLPLHHVLAR